VLSITTPTTPPFQEVCGNCHLVDIIISLIGDVHCNVCQSKSKVIKSRFLRATIATSKEPILLTIEGKNYSISL